MSDGVLISMLLTVITAATALVFAALGELVTERSGVLNLGVEGMMLAGAVAAFATAIATGSAFLAVVAGCAAGCAKPFCAGWQLAQETLPSLLRMPSWNSLRPSSNICAVGS